MGAAPCPRLDYADRHECTAMKNHTMKLLAIALGCIAFAAVAFPGDAKKSMDPAASQAMIDLIDEISAVFWQTEESKATGVYPPA